MAFSVAGTNVGSSTTATPTSAPMIDATSRPRCGAGPLEHLRHQQPGGPHEQAEHDRVDDVVDAPQRHQRNDERRQQQPGRDLQQQRDDELHSRSPRSRFATTLA